MKIPKRKPKLKPCPFCGSSKVDIYEFHIITDPRVKCEECEATTRECETIEEAASAWNVRVK